MIQITSQIKICVINGILYDWWWTYNTLTTWCQLIAAVTGVISVYLSAKGRASGWWWSMPSIFATAFVFYLYGLYGEMLLQLAYLVSAVYGLYHWVVLGQRKKVRYIRKTTQSEAVVFASTTLVLWLVFWYWLRFYTDSNTPILDGLLTSSSLMAQFMMASQLVENWSIWIVTDLLSIGLFWYKGIYLFMLLYLVFTIVAYLGMLDWKRRIKEGQVFTQ